MITYQPGEWSLLFAFQLKGSVFPKALVWAVPCSISAFVLHIVLRSEMGNVLFMSPGKDGAVILNGFTFILGFLIVFRSQQAYSRWWEGGTLLQKLRGEWFNAFSSILAFRTRDETKQQDAD